MTALRLGVCVAALVLASCADAGRDRRAAAPTNSADASMRAVAAKTGVAGESGAAAAATPGGALALAGGTAHGLAAGSAGGASPDGSIRLDRWGAQESLQPRRGALANLYDAALPDGGEGFKWSVDVDGPPDGFAPGEVSRFQGTSTNTFSFSGKGALSDGLNLSIKAASVDLHDTGADEVGGFLLDNTGDWKRGANSDFRIGLGMLEDRLRFTTRYGVSRFRESGMSEEEAGDALIQRIDAGLLSSDNFSFNVFGVYSRTDTEYTTVEDMLDDKKVKKKFKSDKEGDFVDPGWQSTELGGKVGLGPMYVTLAGVSESAFAGKKEGTRKTGYNAKVSLNVDSVLKSAGASSGGIRAIAPDWMWVGYEDRTVDVVGSSTDDRSSMVKLGGSWNWKGAYLNVDYWRFFYDKRQPGSGDADWLGDGLDVSVGYYQPRWSVYAGLSRNRSNSMGAWGSTDAGNDGWLSFSLRPEKGPDFTASVSTYLYRGDYTGGSSGSDDLTLGAELDFSKYLETSPYYDTGLKMVFQYNRERKVSEWGGSSSDNADNDFFVGVRYDLTPKR